MTSPTSSASPDVLAGLASLQKDDIEEARRFLEKALAADAADANALQLLGACYLREGDFETAIGLIQKALDIRPEHAGARSNLGSAFFAQGKFGEATAHFEKVLAAKPDNPVFHYNLANAYYASGRHDEAREQYRIAYVLKPDYAEALGLYTHGNQLQCDWSDAAAREALLAMARDGKYAGPPFLLHSLLDDPAAHLSAARAYSRAFIRAPASVLPHRARDPKAKIRVAYVSYDFNRSAVCHLIVGLLEDHDRSRFEICAISTGSDDGSDLRRRVERGVDRFVDIRGYSDKAAADLMRGLAIDIAVDLNGHTQGNRMAIFSHRPARIQVSYLGFGGTTGTDYFDYVIVDPIIVPADQQPFFSEKLYPLAGCYLPVDQRRHVEAQAPSRALCGLPAEGFVFCSFNSSYKITPEVFDVWTRLLKRVDGSTLWLAGGQGETEKNLREESARRGVEPSRIVFAPKVPDMSTHLARYRLADLFLDTFPCNAATTASDALSMGLPVVTLSGKTCASRMAGSILASVGLQELVTYSLEEYEAAAVGLAAQPERLAALKKYLDSRRRNSTLFDADGHRRRMEAAFEDMVANYSAREAAP